jgi:hypothetical protein
MVYTSDNEPQAVQTRYTNLPAGSNGPVGRQGNAAHVALKKLRGLHSPDHLRNKYRQLISNHAEFEVCRTAMPALCLRHIANSVAHCVAAPYPNTKKGPHHGIKSRLQR